MRRQRTSKRGMVGLAVVVLVGVGVGVTGYLRGMPVQDTTRFYLPSDGGPVLFEHARHGEAAAGCVDCHHELAGAAADCLDCHDDEEYTPEAATHEELLDFHERACDTCHEIAPDEEAASCRECHAEEVARIYHLGCNACHLATDPARFAVSSGDARCAVCHLK